MKNYFKLGFLAFACNYGIANAQTVTTSNLVNVTGTLDASFSVKMTEEDTKQLLLGLQGINNMPVITVDVNSIYSEKDQHAFSEASKEVSRVILEAAKALADMRAIVYKLDIDLQLDTQKRFTTQIYSAYQKHFQTRFTKLLTLFLGNGSEFNSQLTAAMETCFTTSCVQDIADAQLDLVEFGRAINTRIDLNSSKQWEYKHQNFKSRLVKDVIRLTVDETLKTNEQESVYVKVLRFAATPFVVAAKGTAQSVQNMGEYIVAAKFSRYELIGNPISKKTKTWNKDLNEFENRVGANYSAVITNNGGANQYKSYQAGLDAATLAIKQKETSSNSSDNTTQSIFKNRTLSHDKACQGLKKLSTSQVASIIMFYPDYPFQTSCKWSVSKEYDHMWDLQTSNGTYHDNTEQELADHFISSVCAGFCK